jgi:hypothetical protein
VYVSSARLRAFTLVTAMAGALIAAPSPALASGVPVAVNAVTGSAVEPIDPLRKADADGMSLNRIAPAWSWTTGSSEVTVAVVDSGASAVEDLDDGRLLPGRDIVNGDDDPTDDQGHGTYVATTIAGEADNNVGGAGVCWACRILPVKVLKPTSTGGTTGTAADAAAGIVWAADHGADIINVSFAGTVDSPVLREAVAHATAAGALIVASAGDRKSTAPTYPASIEPVIAVGGTDVTGKPLPDASTNPATAPWIDITAVGSRYGTDELGAKVRYTSSSAAAPLVSGAAALALSLRPDATAAQLRTALLGQSVDAGTAWGGAKQLDAGKVTRALGPEDTTAPIVTDTGLPLDGTVLCACRRYLYPTVLEDRDLVRLELVVRGDVVAKADASPMRFDWTPTGLDGPVDVTVRAYDSSGNVGAVSVTVGVDTTAPTASFLTPENYAIVDGLTTFTIEAGDDTAGIDFLGHTIDTTVGKGPWTVTYDFSSFEQGWFSFPVNLRDRAGNIAGFHHYVGIDHDIPVMSFDETDFPAILQGPIDFHLGVTDASLVSFELIVGGKVVNSTGLFSRVLAWPGADKLTGAYELTFRATDEAGHTSEVTRAVVVDNTAPKVGAVSLANKTLVRGTFAAGASGVTDASGIARVELHLNNSLYGKDTTAPYSVSVKSGIRNGKLLLEWVAYDKAGNRTSVSRTVIADNKVPTVSITKGPKNKAKVKGTVTLSVAAKDANGIAKVQLLVNGKVVATDTTSAYSLKVNTAKQKKTMKVQVRAYDKAGNLKSASTRTWYRR